MKTTLTIAGSDPSGGAGIQSDLTTFRDFGVFGLSAIASLTAQNFSGVDAFMNAPPLFLIKQIETLLKEFNVNAIKTGMLGSAKNMSALAGFFKTNDFKGFKIVVDPVMRSSSGMSLIDRDGLREMKKLVSFAMLATPNIPEAEALAGIKIRDESDMEEAARIIYSYGPLNVLIKGGHLKGAPVDVLYGKDGPHYFKGKRIRCGKRALHGTGCMLSAAIAAGIAKGEPLIASIGKAKKYVEDTVKKRQGMFKD